MEWTTRAGDSDVNATLGICFTSSAIRSVFIETVPGLGFPTIVGLDSRGVAVPGGFRLRFLTAAGASPLPAGPVPARAPVRISVVVYMTSSPPGFAWRNQDPNIAIAHFAPHRRQHGLALTRWRGTRDRFLLGAGIAGDWRG